MPYVFQKEIGKKYPYQTGCEKFDSLYRLYNVFKDLSCFLINIFFDTQENISLMETICFLRKVAEEYQISHLVVRCEQKAEVHPIPAVAFSDITEDSHLEKCARYIQDRLKQGYNCIVHEVVTGDYPSNRLDWLYSFGIWYEKAMPRIEIYPATDASSIKWGKLSPLDIFSLDADLNLEHIKIRDAEIVERYQKTKINEWIEQFKTEIDDSFSQKIIFTRSQDLSDRLKQDNHVLFNLRKIDLCIHQTKNKLVDIALKYASYAREHNINSDETIIHGSLLYNNRMIIWDISTNKRWQYLQQIAVPVVSDQPVKSKILIS